MALQGTLDTFALPDVLRLLATTRKSGRLLVQGDTGTGSLYLDGGSIVAGETTFAPTEAGHEVLFELLRLGDGSFLFDPADTTDNGGAPAEVEDVINAAEASHAEWLDLSTVVPSLDVAITLAEDLPGDAATVDGDRWHLIVGIGSGTTVRALADRLELRELPVLRATRGLVDDGLATIGGHTVAPVSQPPTAPSKPAADLPAIGDDPSAGDLFDDSAEELPGLPEPLPERGGGAQAAADPFVEAASSETDAASGAKQRNTLKPLGPRQAAKLEAQIGKLPDEQRRLVEEAAESYSPEAVDQLLEELPGDVLDRDLLRRFLGSVRS